jgi:hypothetical protein
LQTGYLTIQAIEQSPIQWGIQTYHLTIPNLEVKQSFYDSILNMIYDNKRENLYNQQCIKGLTKGEPTLIEKSFKGLLASLPHHWYTNNTIQNYEGFYCSIIYAFVAGMGLDLIPEDVTNYGRIDFTIKALDKLFIFEFKVVDEDDTDTDALAQIKEKKYAEKYQAAYETIFLIGVHFSKAERNVVKFEWEK